MQGTPSGLLLGREEFLSKLETSMKSESQLKNSNELLGAFRLSPKWFAGFV